MQQRKDAGIFGRWLEAVLCSAAVLVLARRLEAGDWPDVYVCVLTLGLIFLPEAMGKWLGVFLPEAFRSVIGLFVFSSEILGEILGWYQSLPWWDAGLHTVSGFFFCAVGWFLATLRSRSGTEAVIPAGLAGVTAVCVSVTVGVVWELFEWSADRLFGLDMQKDTVLHDLHSLRLAAEGGSGAVDGIREVLVVCADGSSRRLGIGGYLDPGLNDTMEDLLVNVLGAVVFVLLIRGQGRAGAWLREHFVPRREKP